MILELGGLEVDLSALGRAIAGQGKEPSTYTIDVASHDPPQGYEVGVSRDGAVEIARPRIPIRSALLWGACSLLFLAWQVFSIQKGAGVFAVVGALVIVYWLLTLVVGAIVQTSWVVSDHWLLRRRVLGGLPAWETEFAVDLIEIDNAQWKTGRGSTDTLRLITPPPMCERAKLDASEEQPLRLGPQPRVMPQPGRGLIAANILQLGQFLAHHANVPLQVVVRQVPEPSSD